MTLVLDSILDDLRAGLARRAARRRRARVAGATAAVSAALLAAGVTTAGMTAGGGVPSAPAGGGGMTATALLTGQACSAQVCWSTPSRLHLGQDRSNRPQ